MAARNDSTVGLPSGATTSVESLGLNKPGFRCPIPEMNFIYQESKQGFSDSSTALPELLRNDVDIWIPIGEGSTSQVFKRMESGKAPVAAKLLYEQCENEGTQEYNALRLIGEHASIVRLYDLGLNSYLKRIRPYLSFELMDSNLETYLANYKISVIRCNITNDVIQRFMKQLCAGLAACHRCRVIHRDINPENILVNAATKSVKLADFGKSIILPEDGDGHVLNNSEFSVKLPYRAPELLLGAYKYTSAIDIWALGCVFARMSRGRLLFDAVDEDGIKSKIFGLLGIPNETSWPGVTQALGSWRTFALPPVPINEVVGRLTDLGCDLLEKMLRLNPYERITAEEALQHPYLRD